MEPSIDSVTSDIEGKAGSLIKAVILSNTGSGLVEIDAEIILNVPLPEDAYELIDMVADGSNGFGNGGNERYTRADWRKEEKDKAPWVYRKLMRSPHDPKSRKEFIRYLSRNGNLPTELRTITSSYIQAKLNGGKTKAHKLPNITQLKGARRYRKVEEKYQRIKSVGMPYKDGKIQLDYRREVLGRGLLGLELKLMSEEERVDTTQDRLVKDETNVGNLYLINRLATAGISYIDGFNIMEKYSPHSIDSALSAQEKLVPYLSRKDLNGLSTCIFYELVNAESGHHSNGRVDGAESIAEEFVNTFGRQGSQILERYGGGLTMSLTKFYWTFKSMLPTTGVLQVTDATNMNKAAIEAMLQK